MQKNFIRNTIKCNCTPAKIRYNVLLCARLPQHSTDTGTRDSTATSAPHLISIQKPKMCHLIFPYFWCGTGAEVNPESWTQLKGSHEAQIKFGRETCSD